MVRQRREESLVDSSTSELLRERIHSQHIADGVGLALDPEVVAELDVVRGAVRLGLARVVDDVVVVWLLDGAPGLLEVAREEVVPGLVAVVFGGRVAFEHFFEFEAGFVGTVGNGGEVGETDFAEPAVLVVQAGCRGRGLGSC